MIFLIRHGQTELNHRRVVQGRSDYPLNESGIAQAQEAAAKLRGVFFDAVYTSPLIRAVQTARILAPALEPVVDERLIDMDYGPLEGTRIDAMSSEAVAYFRDFLHKSAPEGMEQISAVARRAGAFLEDRCKAGGNLLVVTHAIVIKRMLEHMAPEAAGGIRPGRIANGAIYTAEYLPDGAWSVPAEISQTARDQQ